MWTGVLLGTVGAISTENWPQIWIVIEVNLISFLPLITIKWRAKKVGMIYFIVQSIGSQGILCGGVLSDTSTLISKWVPIRILLKSRLAPLHFWGASLIPKLRALTAFVFLTWQKIVPLFLFLITTSKFFINAILFINLLVSTRCRLGTKNIYVLIFFSSLIQIGWVISAPLGCACLYFMLYAMSSGPIYFDNLTTNMPILILNMAGLPPITGFIIKLKVLQLISMRLGILLLAFSTLLLFVYIRSFILSKKNGSLRLRTIAVCCLGWVF